MLVLNDQYRNHSYLLMKTLGAPKNGHFIAAWISLIHVIKGKTLNLLSAKLKLPQC